MLLDIRMYKIKPTGIIHVGAHHAQEHDKYVQLGCKNIVYIEPAKEAYEYLKKKFAGNKDVTIINAACGSKIGRQKLNVERSNQGQSNSLLPMGTHLKQHPGIEFVESYEVDVITLDILNSDGYDMLVMDCQGYEGEILKGAKETLKKMQWVYTEVNREEVYKGCALIDEIDELLKDFTRVALAPWIGGWSDALYKRK